tara:strand:+ start:85 stop:465 length:381 start_codon:yes stop_codon:yes gene_type:complete
MSDYTPDNWVVLKVKEGKGTFPIYKVLAGWSGGYLDGDSWRINSGITQVKQDGDYYEFFGLSGSCYRCHKEQYTLRMNTAGIFKKLWSHQEFKGQIQMMDEDTDWSSLRYMKQDFVDQRFFVDQKK